MKYEVFIYGTVPDCIELEAGSKDEAVAAAWESIRARLDLLTGFSTDHLATAANKASTPKAKERRRSKWTRSNTSSG